MNKRDRMTDSERRAEELAPELATTATAEVQLSTSRLETNAMGVNESSPLICGQAFGKYLIMEEVGAGGMGIVYAAYDPDLDRKVALKLLRRSTGPGARDARARLLREAQAMARLPHPNVVPVYEVGTVMGRDFVAMEFVDGETLDVWLGIHRSPREIISAFVDAGRALAVAHRVGLVHRDFKPTNVLIGRDGRVRVTDFGLARRMIPHVGDVVSLPEPEDEFDSNAMLSSSLSSSSLSSSPSSPSPSPSSSPVGRPVATDGVRIEVGSDISECDGITRTGAVIGTPAYMAPEQYNGDDVDARADQFGFCAALYEALCGWRPFAGDSFAVLRENVCAGNIRPMADGVPVHARRVLDRGLQANPEGRYQSMRELLGELARDLHPVRRQWVMAAAIVSAVLCLMALLGFVLRPPQMSAAMVCRTSAERQLEGVWNSEAQARVRLAFATTGVAYSHEVYDRFARVIDDHAAEWVAVHAGSCEATRVRREQDEEALILQMACLQRQRDQLATLIHASTNIDRRGIDRAIQAARGLPPVAACTDLEALSRGVLPPASTMRDEVAMLRGALNEAQALDDTGHSDDALMRAEAVLNQAKSLGYKPLLVEVYYTLGQLYRSVLRISDAEAALQEAELLAEEAGYDEYRARSLLAMTELLAEASSRFAEARSYGRRARAVIARFGREPGMHVSLNLALGHIFLEEDQWAAAEALLKQTEEDYAFVLEADQVKKSQVLRQRGKLAWMRAEFFTASYCYRRALELTDNALGPDHPDAVALVEAVAALARLTGHYDVARAYDPRIWAYWRSERGLERINRGRFLVPSQGSRTIRGRVLDRRGEPVVGAEVVAGRMLRGDGKYIYTSQGARIGVGAVGRSVTDSDGAFVIEGLPQEAVTVVAEHSEHGRARHVIVDARAAQVSQMLTLQPYGSISGRAVRGDAHMRLMRVIAAPRPHGRMAEVGFSAAIGSDGGFELPRLAPGAYDLMLQPVTSDGKWGHMIMRQFEISPGQHLVLDAEVPLGEQALAVEVAGQDGVLIPSAEVLLLAGEVNIERVGDFDWELFAEDDLRIGHWLPGQDVNIPGLTPGLYSVCVVPIPGDYRNPEVERDLGYIDSRMELSMYCQPVTVSEGEAITRHRAVVPAAVVPQMVPPIGSGDSKAL